MSPKWTRSQKWAWHPKVQNGTFGVPIGTNLGPGPRALKLR